MPFAYTKLREKQRKEREAAEAAAKSLRTIYKKEEKNLYGLVAKALRPYNGETLEGHKVSVKTFPKEMKIHFYVDKYHFLTFRLERTYGRCSCESQCDCERTSWLSVDVTQHRKKGDCGCYFSCDDYQNADKFAFAMAKMMDEYQWIDF